jgi:CBS domain-containing protein
MSIQMDSSLSVAEVALPLGGFPVVPPTMLLKAALEEMGRSRLGIVCVVDDAGKLLGILTDGDIRRQLLNMQKPFSAFFGDDVIDHAVRGPTTTQSDAPLLDAVEVMEAKQVWDLPVLDRAGKLSGLLHLHPVVKKLLEMTD